MLKSARTVGKRWDGLMAVLSQRGQKGTVSQPRWSLTFLQYPGLVSHVLNEIDGAGTRKLKRVLRSVSKMRFPCPSNSSSKHSLCRSHRKRFGELNGTFWSQT